jgi:hypothetical protein
MTRHHDEVDVKTLGLIEHHWHSIAPQDFCPGMHPNSARLPGNLSTVYEM